MTILSALTLVTFAIVLLLSLVLALRLHAFLALLLTSFVVALIGGVPLQEIATQIQQAMGGNLGYISIVIALGALFGEVLQHSGGASVIAQHLLRTWGEHRASWALALTGLVVAIPVFFDVAFILFVPLLYGLSVRTGRALLGFALPLLAGLAVAHAFIPPTPGPTAVAGLLGAELGWVIFFGLLAGMPALLIGGIGFGRLAARRVPGKVPAQKTSDATSDIRSKEPDIGSVLALIFLPLILILLATASKVLLPEEGRAYSLLQFVGHPFFALLLTTLLAFYLLGARRGASRQELLGIADRAFLPVGLVLMVTGAGGVLGKVLVAAGVGEAVAQGMATLQLPLVPLGFALAAVVRVAQGSATVSMVTAAGLLSPVIEAGTFAAPLLGAVVVAIAAGATVLSHVNDSGFWLVSRYLGLTERETLQTWTVMTTILGTVALIVVWTASTLI